MTTWRTFESEAERVAAEREARRAYELTGVYRPPVSAEWARYNESRHVQHPMVAAYRRPAPPPVVEGPGAEVVAVWVAEASRCIDGVQARSLVCQQARQAGASDRQTMAAMRAVESVFDARQPEAGWPPRDRELPYEVRLGAR